MPEFYLLMKEHCPLCTQAIQLIYAQKLDEPIQLNVVDIASDPALVQEYATLVPVLVRAADDAEMKWPFAEIKLQEFLSL
ncbi:thioredoxin family protein [Aliidiomarina iranensis]|uniref:Thioredoxin family protein n=1 Tax=Aliidiomarina iranensis TaxID=1434071 RepID=A0A432W058_9GAMM|nr:glutaredoxin family protein [Aliidiomarina iranensis]RUO22395.1 thioredoxin family protein [Aliidiomarina iranensis]